MPLLYRSFWKWACLVLWLVPHHSKWLGRSSNSKTNSNGTVTKTGHTSFNTEVREARSLNATGLRSRPTLLQAPWEYRNTLYHLVSLLSCRLTSCLIHTCKPFVITTIIVMGIKHVRIMFHLITWYVYIWNHAPNSVILSGFFQGFN